MTDEGRMITYGEGSGRRFLYEYDLKDHLGNNRVTFMGTDLGGAIDVVQTTNYYPCGPFGFLKVVYAGSNNFSS